VLVRGIVRALSSLDSKSSEPRPNGTIDSANLNRFVPLVAFCSNDWVWFKLGTGVALISAFDLRNSFGDDRSCLRLRSKLKANRQAPCPLGPPWVFANEVEALLPAEHDGEVVECRDRADRFLGTGVYNSKSQIIWRRFSRGARRPGSKNSCAGRSNARSRGAPPRPAGRPMPAGV